MKSFENKVVVVTGGAHGIGATVVSEFEKEGAKVAYIDIRENPCFVGDLSKKEVLEKILKRLNGRGTRLLPVYAVTKRPIALVLPERKRSQVVRRKRSNRVVVLQVR